MNRTCKHFAFGILACAILATSMVGCVARPGRDQKGLLVGPQRVLALDFGQRVTGPRLHRLRRLPKVLSGEFGRAHAALGLDEERPLTATVGDELQRTKRIYERGAEALGSEAMRRPKLFRGAWPSSFEFAQNTANGIDTLGRLLGPTRRPLGEFDDYTHRTDHTDRRPRARCGSACVDACRSEFADRS